VQAKSASAQFRTVGRLGEVAFDGQQATAKIDEAATARITVQDGDVTVGRLGGDAEVSTGRGDTTGKRDQEPPSRAARPAGPAALSGCVR
jgi:hypothetical protein